MKIEDMLTNEEIAEAWGQTPHNIRKTYVHKNVTRLPIIVIGILFTREKVTPREIEEALIFIKAKREYARSKRAKKNTTR